MAYRIRNSVCKFVWPELIFKPTKVFLANHTRVSIVPHLGEFDQDALFVKKLDYETSVFAWLAKNAALQYELVIEIGANVGIYTVFLDSLARNVPHSKLTKIIAFEPSQEAYRRLIENLRANDVQHVVAFPAAVASQSGLQPFFEPTGHLTNGSFIQKFAQIFSDSVVETTVVVVGAIELERYFKDYKKILIKIDAEGFEPDLVASLGTLLLEYRPDLLIEVLDFTAHRLEKMSELAGYRKFLITSEGVLRESETLFAAENYRDWLLEWRTNNLDSA